MIMGKPYSVYKYEGPVMIFNQCVDRCWTGETYAFSESKAKSNLTWRYKRDHDLASNSKISLPGRIVKVGI